MPVSATSAAPPPEAPPPPQTNGSDGDSGGFNSAMQGQDAAQKMGTSGTDGDAGGENGAGKGKGAKGAAGQKSLADDIQQLIKDVQSGDKAAIDKDIAKLMADIGGDQKAGDQKAGGQQAGGQQAGGIPAKAESGGGGGSPAAEAKPSSGGGGGSGSSPAKAAGASGSQSILSDLMQLIKDLQSGDQAAIKKDMEKLQADMAGQSMQSAGTTPGTGGSASMQQMADVLASVQGTPQGNTIPTVAPN